MKTAQEYLELGNKNLNTNPRMAEEEYRRALSMNPDYPTKLRVLYGLGSSLLKLGKNSDAKYILNEGFVNCKDDTQYLLVGRLQTLYGRACIAMDDFETGIPKSDQAVKTLRLAMENVTSEQEKKDAENSFALACFFLSSAKYQTHNLDEACELTNTALEIWQKNKGRRCADVATCLNNLGRICEEKGDIDRGVKFHREAASIYKEVLGIHPQTAFSLGNLGTALASAGMFRDAIDSLQECIDMYAKCGHTEGNDISAYKNNLNVCNSEIATS